MVTGLQRAQVGQVLRLNKCPQLREVSLGNWPRLTVLRISNCRYVWRCDQRNHCACGSITCCQLTANMKGNHRVGYLILWPA